MANILVLTANTNILTPTHGGSERGINLVEALGKDNNVEVLIFTWEDRPTETIQHSKTINFNVLPAERDAAAKEIRIRRRLTDGNHDITIGMMAQYLVRYRNEIAKRMKNTDLIVLDSHTMSMVLDLVPDMRVPVLHVSYNCEFDLARQRYGSNSEETRYSMDMEKAAIKLSTAIGVCSDADGNKLTEIYKTDKPMHLIKNGTDIIKDIVPGENFEKKNILYIASAHPPNIKAAHRVVQIAREIPEYTFTIAGDAGLSINKSDITKNVIITGRVTDEERDKLFRESFAFINPVEVGGGTHLKLSRALANGLPIISTEFGARGFMDDKDNGIFIADTIKDIVLLLESLKDKDNYTKACKAALKYAKQFDWQDIKKAYVKIVDGILEDKGLFSEVWKNRKKVLVYSIIRDEARFMDLYHRQLKKMVQDHPEYEFFLSIYENDSGDNTKQLILNKDWSFFSKFVFMSESLDTPSFGSTKDALRVENLSIARNKAILNGGLLEQVDYIMMVESDMTFDSKSVDKLLNFHKQEPDFDIVSTITIRNNDLYDAWATRKTPEFIKGVSVLSKDWRKVPYDKYYSTSNGLCLYRAEPFREGARYGWMNDVTNEADCDTVIICQDFHNRGYHNIYIIHDAPVYHEHH